MMAADVFAVGDDDVVVVETPYPGGRAAQPVLPSGSVAQPGFGGLGRGIRVLVSAQPAGGRDQTLCGHRLLAQYALVQGGDGGTRIDAKPVGQSGFETAIGAESVRLALGDVVGGDELRPQR